MIELDKIERIIELSETILQYKDAEIDFQKISDGFLALVSAKYVGFNLFDEDGGSFRTVALSGNGEMLKKAVAVLGMPLKGKRWPADLARQEKINEKTVTRFNRLRELSEEILPAELVGLIEKTFNLGEVIIVKVEKDGLMLGDFTIIMEKGDAFENEKVAELYTRQLGILITKKRDEDKLRKTEKELRESEAVRQAALDRFEKVFNSNPSLMGLSRVADHRFTEVNKSFLNTFGYEKEEVIGKTPLELGLFVTPAEMESAFESFKTEGKIQNIEMKVRKKGGEIICGLFSGEVIENHGVALFLTVMNNITKQKQLEEEQKISVEKYSGIFHQSPIAIEIYDAEGRLLEVNDACLKMFGIKSKEEISGLALFDDPNIGEERKKTLVNEKKIRFEAEFSFEKVKELNLYQTSCTGVKHLDISIKEMTVDTESAGYIVQINDISEQKRAQNELEHLSLYDHLTGLYNRRFYEAEALRLDRERNLPLTLLMGDVNDLKQVNDHYGHMSGDELLKKVSSAIKKACREDDIIARLGGDEFVALLPKTTREEAEKIIARIDKLVAEERIDDQHVSVAFGCDSKTSMEEDLEEIFKKAELAMYEKKQRGQGNGS